MHRGAYASGTVFTASMLDTLLPQMYNKRPADVLGVIRQLLGLRNMSAMEASDVTSGLLAQVEITEAFLDELPGEPIYNSAALFVLKVRHNQIYILQSCTVHERMFLNHITFLRVSLYLICVVECCVRRMEVVLCQ